MNLPRLLLVGNFLSQSGTGSRQICEELACRFGDSGMAILTTSWRKNRALRVFDMLVTVWFRREDYDLAIVDVFSGPSFLWAWAVGWLLRVLGKPFVFALHGGGLPDYSESRGRRVRRVLGWATVVVAPSQYLAERMAPYRMGIEVIPNGIEIDNYTYRVRDGVAPKIVWLRAFHTMYDPTMAPQVLKRVRERFPEAHLVMVGPDKDGSLGVTVRVAKEEGVYEAIDFIGAIPKETVPEVLNRGDIFINTTTVDNTPVSVIEAMACGLCVVSTDVGGLPYLLENEKDALLVRVGDAEAMAAAVCRLLEDQALATRLSSNGRQKVEGYDWSIALPLWDALFSKVIDRA